MGSVTEFGKKVLKEDLKFEVKENLADKVAGFTFSRRPRAERIAAILAEVLKKLDLNFVCADENIEKHITSIAKEIEPYAFKDFAVRFGKLDDATPTRRI